MDSQTPPAQNAAVENPAQGAPPPTPKSFLSNKIILISIFILFISTIGTIVYIQSHSISSKTSRQTNITSNPKYTSKKDCEEKTGNKCYSSCMQTDVNTEQCTLMDWVPFINSSQDNIETPDWKTYTSFLYSFLIKYPNDLKVSEKENGVIFDNEYKLLKREIPENKYIGITVFVEKTSRDFSLEEYLKQAYPENKFGIPVFEKRKNDFREVEIDNIKGLVSSRGLSFEDITKTAWVKKGIYVYKISAVGYQTGSTYTKIGEKVFDQILSTFKFTQ